MKEYVLIVHGGWNKSDGQDTDGQDALYELPDNLIIKTYGLQNTSLKNVTAKVILEKLIKNKGSITMNQGENNIGGINVIYKEYKKGTQSSMISNYDIGGEDSLLLGLYTINPYYYKKIYFEDGFRSTLNDFIREQDIKGVLHLLCCQNFT